MLIMTILPDDIHIYPINLHKVSGRACNEAVVPDAEDDGWTVYIDKNLSDQKYHESFDHALEHILGNHFELHDVQDIEYEAHNGI